MLPDMLPPDVQNEVQDANSTVKTIQSVVSCIDNELDRLRHSVKLSIFALFFFMSKRGEMMTKIDNELDRLRHSVKPSIFALFFVMTKRG